MPYLPNNEWINGEDLRAIFNGGFSAVINVSGAKIPILDLINAGWFAKIFRGRYGGSSHVSFRSGDGKSVLKVRLALSDTIYGTADVINHLAVIATSATLTSHMKTDTAICLSRFSDSELLRQLHANAAGRVKHKKRRANPEVVQHAKTFLSAPAA